MINTSFFSISSRGTSLSYCDVDWLALEMSWVHAVIFEVAPKYCNLDGFVDYEGYSIFSIGSLPTVVDKMVIWIKFTIPAHFSLLIPKMLMSIVTNPAWPRPIYLESWT